MTPPPPAKDNHTSDLVLAESLRAAVGRFVRSVRSQSGTPHDAQADVLAELAHAGSMSIAGLAEIRGVTHQSMRLVVIRLEDAGLLERKPDPADRRGWLIALTDEGHRAAQQDRQTRSIWLAKAISTKLSAQERTELNRAVPLLLRLIEAE
ncbi:MarR family transcriptional regulator [Castellaniella daejeonensis]|uniref:MarR family transcriptional regulator n=1 Tax=Castellaniella daejeonensis TaxID=659013 RepID=A0ABN0TSA8_9BURK